MLALLQQDIAQAERYLTDAQTLNQHLGEIEGLVSNVSDLTQVALEQGDFTKAENLAGPEQPIGSQERAV